MDSVSLGCQLCPALPSISSQATTDDELSRKTERARPLCLDPHFHSSLITLKELWQGAPVIKTPLLSPCSLFCCRVNLWELGSVTALFSAGEVSDSLEDKLSTE